MEKCRCKIIQSISQWQTKEQRNYKVNFTRNLNVPKNNVILMPLKICFCNKSIDNLVVAIKETSQWQGKIKHDFEVVCARNLDVVQKTLY